MQVTSPGTSGLRSTISSSWLLLIMPQLRTACLRYVFYNFLCCAMFWWISCVIYQNICRKRGGGWVFLVIKFVWTYRYARSQNVFRYLWSESFFCAPSSFHFWLPGFRPDLFKHIFLMAIVFFIFFSYWSTCSRSWRTWRPVQTGQKLASYST